jgi:RecA/RadA recombinase
MLYIHLGGTRRDDEMNSRCSTGVEGLDEILHGGFLEHRLYLIGGDTGVGKTTLSQFVADLHRSRCAGQPQGRAAPSCTRLLIRFESISS